MNTSKQNQLTGTDAYTRRAVIDLGSNSFRLVIFESGKRGEEHWWRHAHEIYEVVRIGAGEEASGKLSKSAMQRALATLEIFSHYCSSHGIAPENIDAVATSAIRAAKNRDEFIRSAQKLTGLSIRVLNAEEEAYYDYLAAMRSTKLKNGLILDLGGGSLQLISVKNRELSKLASWPLGSVRLTERFLANQNPTTQAERKQVKEYVHKQLQKYKWLSNQTEIIGLGGTIRNLAAAIQRQQNLPTFNVQGFCFKREDLRVLIDKLANCTSDQRGKIPGIKAARGDIILAGALAIETILEITEIDQLTVTEFGLREGVFSEPNAPAQQTPAIESVDQVRRATVLSLAARHDLDRTHSKHVTKIACSLFDQLTAQKIWREEEGTAVRDLLWSSAQLHDIGMVVDYDDHHKHSRYIVANSALAGFDQREAALIAQTIRYHRKGIPGPGPFARLLKSKADLDLLNRLAAILRLAEDFDRARDQSVVETTVSDDGQTTTMTLQTTTAVNLAHWASQRTDELFSRAFARQLVIRQTRTDNNLAS